MKVFGIARLGPEPTIYRLQGRRSTTGPSRLSNILSANPQKTEYMIIGHPPIINNIEVHEPLRLNGSDIKRVTNTKSLGIIVDERLNWERQYKTVQSKSRGGLPSLRRLKSIFPHFSLSNVYRALVESPMRYADVIWGSLWNSNIESSQLLQDRAVCMIHTSRTKDNWTPKFLAVEQLIAVERTVMVYTIFNKLCPENLWNKYHLRSHFSRYNTRFCRNI